MNSKQLIAAVAALTAAASFNALAADAGRARAAVLTDYIKAEPNVVRAGSVTESNLPARSRAQVLAGYISALPATAPGPYDAAVQTLVHRTRGEVLADLDKALPADVLERRSGARRT
jgi:hypothetical protein